MPLSFHIYQIHNQHQSTVGWRDLTLERLPSVSQRSGFPSKSWEALLGGICSKTSSRQRIPIKSKFTETSTKCFPSIKKKQEVGQYIHTVVGSPLSRLLPPFPPPLPCGVMGRMLLPILRTGAGPQNPAYPAHHRARPPSTFLSGSSAGFRLVWVALTDVYIVITKLRWIFIFEPKYWLNPQNCVRINYTFDFPPNEFLAFNFFQEPSLH